LDLVECADYFDAEGASKAVFWRALEGDGEYVTAALYCEVLELVHYGIC
jgi:hypothetical protein